MPEPTWTIFCLTLPVTSWINIVIAAGTLVAGTAAAAAAIFTWRGYKSQIEAQRPFIGRIEPIEKVKGDGYIRLKNVGGRAAKNITGKATIFWINDDLVKHCGYIWDWSRISPLAPGIESIVLRIKLVLQDIQKMVSPEFDLDKNRPFCLVFQIEYFDIRKNVGPFNQRFYTQIFRSAEYPHMHLTPEEQKLINEYIKEYSILPETEG